MAPLRRAAGSFLRPAVRRRLPLGRTRTVIYAFSVLVALYHATGASLFGVSLDAHLVVHLCAVMALTFLVFGGPGRGLRAVTPLDLVLFNRCRGCVSAARIMSG